MKRTKLLVLSLFAISVLGTGVTVMANNSENGIAIETQKSGTPAIEFAEKDFNFGIVDEEGGPVSHTFEFTNTGDAPLVIISATASCGCTRPTYPTEPIAPGKKGKIKVTYLPEGRPGEFEKVVKVRTNAKESKKISLRITGTVTPR